MLGSTYKSTASMVWCGGVCWALLIEVQPVWCGVVKSAGFYLQKCNQYGVVWWSVLGSTYRSATSMVWCGGVCWALLTVKGSILSPAPWSLVLLQVTTEIAERSSPRL